MIGFDTDVLWLLTDSITLGATVSFTHSEYTEDFDVIDEFNAQRPGSLFDPLATPFNIKGNRCCVYRRRSSMPTRSTHYR